MLLSKSGAWKVTVVVSIVLTFASIVTIGAVFLAPTVRSFLSSDRSMPRPISVSEEHIHENQSSPPVSVDGIYVRLSGGAAAATRRINSELHGSVQFKVLSYLQGTAKDIGVKEREVLTDRYTVTVLTKRLISVRYDFSVFPLPNRNFYLPSVTVTADLGTGRILGAADIFLPSVLTEDGLQTLSARVGDAALASKLGSDSCPIYDLALTRKQLDGEDDSVDLSFGSRSVDFTLVLPQLGNFPSACGHPVVHVSYCVLSGLISPWFAGGIGDHTAYPSGPVLGAVWGSGQQGYGRSQPCVIFNGGDPTGLVTKIKWHSWGAEAATGDGMALYAPGVVAQGTVQPARIVAFKLGTCRGARAYTAIEWFFPQHGQTFSPNGYIDACTGEPHDE